MNIAVPLDEIEAVEWLERRSCKLVCKELVANGSKYLCIYCGDTQKRKYSETTPWLDNPFCGGVYFEIEAFTPSENSNSKNDEGSSFMPF